MATRRRSSATKSAKPTVSKLSESVTKVTPIRAKRVNKTTRSAKVMPEVTETPKTEEVKVITKTWIDKVKELDGFGFAILPFLYLEGFVKLILKQQLV